MPMINRENSCKIPLFEEAVFCPYFTKNIQRLESLDEHFTSPWFRILHRICMIFL